MSLRMGLINKEIRSIFLTMTSFSVELYLHICTYIGLKVLQGIGFKLSHYQKTKNKIINLPPRRM